MRIKVLDVLRFSLTLALFGGASFGLTLLNVEPADAQTGCTHTACHIEAQHGPAEFECIASPGSNCEVISGLQCDVETCLIPE